MRGQMASTLPSSAPDWRLAGLRFFSYGYFLRQKFGARVQRVSIDAGFTCPNVDGTVTVGGCNFCDNRSFSPSRRLPRQGIAEQIDEGIRCLKRRYDCRQFIAYFQPATNTYAPVERLRELYLEGLAHPDVVGLAIGTRPDCVPNDVLELLEGIAAEHYVALELGMQSMHDRSLQWMNRGHNHASFVGRGCPVSPARFRGLRPCDPWGFPASRVTRCWRLPTSWLAWRWMPSRSTICMP